MSETLIIKEAEVIERQATHLIGTLGHVSEGKSTLIRALTGVKTQRYAKEQERNITIHLGYANCKIYQHRTTGAFHAGAPSADAGEWALVAHLSFVDCPGHEAYLATMLGGASIMDSACLIIAANQEHIPQPQTLEHLIAAELMGLSRIAVIQNKLDLVSEADIRKTHDRISAFVAQSCAETAPIIPISAQHGWGVGRVLDYITTLPPLERSLSAPARLTCVRSFDVNRPGPFVVGDTMKGGVIGGTLDQGVLAVGDWIEIRPGVLRLDSKGDIIAHPILTRIRGIRCEATELPYAIPGSLIAIATDLDPGLTVANGMVGQRVGVPGTLPGIQGELLLRIQRLKRDTHSFSKHKVGQRVRVCSNVMTAEATIVDIDDKRRVRVRLDRPLCVGVGENVAIMRFHKEAGRELLEGAGEVRGVEAWPDVAVARGHEEAVVPSRTIVWEPMERPDWSARTKPSYDDMLDDILVRKEESGGNTKRMRLSDPNLERVPKHTVWVNWVETVESLDAGDYGAMSHGPNLQAFVEAELQTTSTINGKGQLDIRGRWMADGIRGILRRYAKQYKLCSQCQGFDTGLVKDGKTIKIRCARCLSDVMPQGV
jgi:translation initiation factor 2 subunit 3